MSEEKITIDINNNQIEEPRWCQTILVNLICCVIGGVIICCNEKTNVKVCLVLITLVIFVAINILFYLCHLHYKTKVYNSTLYVAKTIMALEKQKENSVVTSDKKEEIKVDGKVLISIERLKDMTQKNSNQSNEQA